MLVISSPFHKHILPAWSQQRKSLPSDKASFTRQSFVFLLPLRQGRLANKNGLTSVVLSVDFAVNVAQLFLQLWARDPNADALHEELPQLAPLLVCALLVAALCLITSGLNEGIERHFLDVLGGRANLKIGGEARKDHFAVLNFFHPQIPEVESCHGHHVSHTIAPDILELFHVVFDDVGFEKWLQKFANGLVDLAVGLLPALSFDPGAQLGFDFNSCLQ